ncbi:MAG: universal stress protein, partial [Anaerolineae bacterium]|nr:universal stress protein [Anaerolineae bacterium]
MLNHILVFIDEQPTSALMSHAVPLAQSSGASITLFGLHSLSRKAIDPVEWYLDQMEAELKLEGSIGALKDHHIPVHTVMLDRLESANLAQVIARYMVEAQVDLLVLPSRLQGLLLDPAISATGLAVSIVPDDIQIAAWPDRENAIRKIMIPLDCSLRAEYALPLASHLAHLTGAELLLAYAIGCTDIPPRLQHDSHVADLMNQVTAYKQLEGQRYLNQVQATLGDAASTRLLVHRNVRHALHDLALQE